MHDHQRQPDAERRSGVLAGARGVHGAAVHLDQVADDRQAQPEAAGLPRRAGVGLPEALEHVGQEVGRDADAGVADRHLDVRVDALQPDLDTAAAAGELDGVGQQVPQHLLQPIGVARDRPDAGIEDGLDAHALGVGGRLHRRDRVVDDHRQLHRLDVQADLARDDPRHVQHVVDDLGQPVGVALERSRGRAPACRRTAVRRAAASRSRRSRSAACAARATARRGTRPSCGWRRGPRRTAGRSRGRPTPTPAMPSAIRSCCSVNTPTRELPKNRPPRTSPRMPRTGTAR